MNKMFLLSVSVLVSAPVIAAVQGLTNEYYQTGLVAQWDAIDNQGTGVHDANATTWVDLKGGRAFTLHNCSFGESALVFSGNSASFGELSATDNTNTFLKAKSAGTVEIVYEYNSDGWPAEGANQALLQGGGAANGPALLYSTAGRCWLLGNSSGTGTAYDSDFGKVNTIAVKYASGVAGKSSTNVFYFDGVARKTGSTVYSTGTTGDKAYIGRRSSETSPIPFSGRLLAIRVYTGKPSAAQLLANSEVDQARFVTNLKNTMLKVDGLPVKAGPITNYGDAQFAAGGTRQMSVPATVTDSVSGIGYACDGWMLLDAANKVVDSGDGNVCDYVHPNPAAYRRLVWKWKVVSSPAPTGPVRYVATNGNDEENDGLTDQTPFLTVQKAIDDVGAYGRVYIAKGTYSTGLMVSLSNNVSLIGNGASPSDVVIQMRTTVASAKRNVLNISTAGSVVTNLTVTNGGGSDVSQNTYYGCGIVMSAGLITDCIITNTPTSNNVGNGGGINMTGGTVRNCTITHCSARDSGGGGKHGGGIYMTAGLVENCRIVKNGQRGAGSGGCGGGVYMTGGTLRGCLIAGNKKYKYGSGLYASGGVVENCTIADNTQNASAATATGVRVEGATTVFRNNIIWGNTAYDGATVQDWSYYGVTEENIYNNDSPTAIAIGSNNIAVDPIFADAANGDYRIGFSDCVDGGATRDWTIVGKDLDGRARLVGENVDLGCYERAASTGLECSFSKEVIDATLSAYRIAFEASVSGDKKGIVYYWTFTREDGLVTTFSGSEYAVLTNTFATGTWDARLDVTNGVLASASSDVAAAFNVRGSVVYVKKDATPVFPYATPETATDSIDAAFPLLGEGGTMYVDEGEYVITEPIDLIAGNGSRILAPKGPDRTSIRLGNVENFTSKIYRGLTLEKSSAYVSGVTFAGGYKGPHYSGSEYGIYGVASMTKAGATITNCVFRDIKEATYGVNVEGMGVRMSAGLVVDCRFENISSTGSGGSGMSGGVLRMTGGTADRIVIDRCFSNTSSGINGTSNGDILYAENAGTVVRNALICRCKAKKTVPVGIKNASLVNCTVACNTNTASATYVKDKVTYANDLTSGVTVYDSGTAKNCIFAGNWSTTLGGMTNLYGTATYTLVDDRDASFVTAENRNRVGDPQFRSIAAGDFRPRSFSPAVNAGDWTALGETREDVAAQRDLLGGSRLVGPGVDMGCYEIVPRGIMILFR